jgi:hypothetical protein
MVLMLSVHPSRQGDLFSEHRIELSGGIASFGEIDRRRSATIGRMITTKQKAPADAIGGGFCGWMA